LEIRQSAVRLQLFEIARCATRLLNARVSPVRRYARFVNTNQSISSVTASFGSLLGQPHRLHKIVNTAGRHAANPGLLDHCDQRLLGGLPRLEKRREVRSLAQLGKPQLERAEARIEATLAISVAVIEPLGAALVTAGTDQAFDISLHQNLQHRFGHGSQKIAITALLQQVNQRHSVVGHRILGGSRVKRCNSTLAALPGDHLSLTRAPGSKFWGIPPVARSPSNFHHARGR